MNVMKEETWRVPVKSWCPELEPAAREQAGNLAAHPAVFHHVALMPDAHSGYGMPIGGVVAMKNSVCPSAVGVDIGCGMIAVRTNVKAETVADMSLRRRFHDAVKTRVPVGEGHSHDKPQTWDGFERFLDTSTWPRNDQAGPSVEDIDRKNLGTLGGGNHFIELQQDDSPDNNVWLMIHSGSRNLGHRIATNFSARAKTLCERYFVDLRDPDLAFLPAEEELGRAYIDWMNFALEYARESRKRMMDEVFGCFADTIGDRLPEVGEIFCHDIHHNYAALESHFGQNVWVHRKGATSAKEGEIGIIPGSMGTASYIVSGLGNPDSFFSCSHGAGRRMSRTAACERLTVAQCDEAMKGIVCGRWGKVRRGSQKGMPDLSEAPGAYKDIESVIECEKDLVKPVIRLTPLACVKG